MVNKYIIWFLLLIAIFFFSFDQQEEQYTSKEYFNPKCNCLIREVYYPNGKRFIYEELDSTTNKGNGISVYFFKNGDTASYSFYIKGLQEGLCYNKYDNGKVRIISYYRNGVSTQSKYYSEEGKLIDVTTVQKTDRMGNLIDYVVEYYNPDEVLTYSKRYSKSKNAELKVYNQKLYDEMMYAKENMTGEQLFKNCTSCHDPLKDATGPNLRGITSRRSETWLRKWISNPAKLIASGDKTAVQIFKQWNNTSMTAFPLKKKDMDKLIAYLKTLN